MTAALITSLEQAGEGSRVMLVDLNAAPFTREFFDALNGYATGGSGRCLETLAIWNARLAASTPVGGWQDISTAPKDGTVFLGCNLDHPSFGSWPMYRRVRHYCDDDGQMQTEDRGGWGKISNLEPDYEDGHTTGPDLLPTIALDALNKSVRYGWKPLPKVEIDAAPPPPSVSIDKGSRPQEAVPTEQAELAVVVALQTACRVLRSIPKPHHVDGHLTYALSDDVPEDIYTARTYVERALALLATPQPADGCSSNGGAG